MKTCTTCNIDKNLTDFNRKKTSKDGLNYVCKSCQKVENETNRLKYKQSGYYKIYRDENLDRLNNYVEINRETINLNKAKYRENNPDKIKVAQTNWRLKNPHNIAFRNLLKNSLIRLGKFKEGHTIELLGYSALELKQHLESLFTEGMSWDNYGEWHIDHKKPVASFDKDTPMNIVNALSNLQPLWATTREINGVIYKGNLNKNKY
jgi:hypothetical protein